MHTLVLIAAFLMFAAPPQGLTEQTLVREVQAAEGLREQGRYAEAESRYLNLKVRAEAAFGRDNSSVALVEYGLAKVYRLEGKYSEGVAAARRSVAILEKTVGPDAPDTTMPLEELGINLAHWGRYEEAEAVYLRVLKTREAHLDHRDPLLGGTLNDLGDLYLRMKKYDEAVRYLKRAVEVLDASPPGDLLATSLGNLAVCYRHMGNFSAAEPLYLRGLRINEQLFGADHPMVAISLDNIAVFYGAQGKWKEADPYSLRALGIFEKTMGPTSPDVAQVLENRATILSKLGRADDARALRAKAIEIRARHAAANPR